MRAKVAVLMLLWAPAGVLSPPRPPNPPPPSNPMRVGVTGVLWANGGIIIPRWGLWLVKLLLLLLLLLWLLLLRLALLLSLCPTIPSPRVLPVLLLLWNTTTLRPPSAMGPATVKLGVVG